MKPDRIDPNPSDAAPGRSRNMRGMAALAVLAAAAALLLQPVSPAGAHEDLIRTDTYDAIFKEYSRRYFGKSFDWKIFKAQAIAESRLDPEAVSGDGAFGLMQLLPETFRQIAEENPDVRGDIRDPRANIAAGIYYDWKLWKLWDAGRPFKERVRFMLGAYNAGKDAILDAQQIAIERKLDPFVWPSIERTLEAVIGSAHRQTVAYVDKVLRIRRQMEGRIQASPDAAGFCSDSSASRKARNFFGDKTPWAAAVSHSRPTLTVTRRSSARRNMASSVSSSPAQRAAS